jgi:hypothetical protein
MAAAKMQIYDENWQEWQMQGVSELAVTLYSALRTSLRPQILLAS